MGLSYHRIIGRRLHYGLVSVTNTKLPSWERGSLSSSLHDREGSELDFVALCFLSVAITMASYKEYKQKYKPMKNTKYMYMHNHRQGWENACKSQLAWLASDWLSG